MEKITIHQPDHLPYPGFFSKVLSSDAYIILDHVQYKKGNYQNRNKISDIQGKEKWLTLPIQKMPVDTPINKIKISPEKKVIRKYLNLLKDAYRHLDGSGEILLRIEDIIGKEIYLSNINIAIIQYILLDLFKYKGQIIFSSDLSVHSAKSDLNLDLINSINGKTYLSGPSGRQYLKFDEFKKSNIDIRFVNYNPYVFTNSLSPYLSVIDPIIRYGENEVKKIILNNTSILDT